MINYYDLIMGTKNHSFLTIFNKTWKEEIEYSCAVKPHVRSDGNRQSGTRKPLGASLLA